MMNKLLRTILGCILLGSMMSKAYAITDWKSGLCYVPNQAKPVFGVYVYGYGDLPKEIVDVRVITYGKTQRDGYIGNDNYIDGDIVEHYNNLKPVWSKSSIPKLADNIKVKLENYKPFDAEEPYRPATPQWLGKTLEIKDFAPFPKDDPKFNVNNPKHRMLFFTVTVDGKTTYQCGENPLGDY